MKYVHMYIYIYIMCLLQRLVGLTLRINMCIHMYIYIHMYVLVHNYDQIPISKSNELNNRQFTVDIVHLVCLSVNKVNIESAQST